MPSSLLCSWCPVVLVPRMILVNLPVSITGSVMWKGVTVDDDGELAGVRALRGGVVGMWLCFVVLVVMTVQDKFSANNDTSIN